MLREPAIEAKLLVYCRQHLAELKCPKKIHLVKETPRTATGKVQRRVAAAAFVSEPSRRAGIRERVPLLPENKG